MSEEKCVKGLHHLQEISRSSDGFVDKVVRWCPDCGAIVIDMECDGRIYPGRYKKMMIPNYRKKIKEL